MKLEKIVIATRNRGKLAEIKELLVETKIVVMSLDDFPGIPEIDEDGETFEDNALKKASFVASSLGMAALADDSGLCVDALSGRPGVMSARYGGLGCDDRQKYLKLLDEMEGVKDPLRTARFVCVVALAFPSGKYRLFKGVCEGTILKEPRGTGGFGYDPVFYNEQFGLTFGEMDSNTKNIVSHRALALRTFVDFVKKNGEIDS
ncbi:MAG: XTP/dITP diphosphatase [Desulfomonilaceae bacterium]